MFKAKLVLPVASLLVSLPLLVSVPAASAASTNYQHVGTINEPNIKTKAGFKSFDISWVSGDTYYLADRSTNAIDAADANDGSFIGYLGQGKFSGQAKPPGRTSKDGPNGVTTGNRNDLWVGDGDSTLKGVDKTSGAVFTSVSTGGKCRADELAYANVGGGRVLMDNPDEGMPPSGTGGVDCGSGPAFLTLWNVSDDHSPALIGSAITYGYTGAGQRCERNASHTCPPAGQGFNAQANGLEQPVWDGDLGEFFVNVPATQQNPNGEIDAVAPNRARIVDVFALGGPACAGTGLAVTPGQLLVVACNADGRLISAQDGHQEANFPDVGGADEDWFNPTDGNAYFARSGAAALGIVNVPQRRFLANVPTGGGSHSVAAQAGTNRIFVPINEGSVPGGGGIAVYHRADRG